MPFMQDILHRLEMRGGSRFFRVGLVVLAVVLLTGGYNWRAYKNMTTQEAMDAASDDLEVALEFPVGDRVLELAPFPLARLDEMVDEFLAEQLARRTETSRSALYARALAEYVARHTPDQITDAMNRACSELGLGVDRFTAAASRRILARSEW